MKLNHLNSFNENFLSIDINSIKKKAYEFHKTKECREMLSKIDSSLLESASREVKTLSTKYDSIDSAIKKITSKFQSKNEGIIGMSILTIFGLHAFIKLLIKLRDNGSIFKYIGSLFSADSDKGNGLKSATHTILSIIFILYLLILIIRSTSWIEDNYKSKLYTTGISWQWSGPNNYIVRDSFNKKYLFKRAGNDAYEIYQNDTLIGSYINDNLIDSKGKIVLEYTSNTDLAYKYSSLPHIDIDLGKLLTGKYKLNIKNLLGSKERLKNINDIKKVIKVKNYELAKKQKEIDILNHRVDSIDRKKYKIYENIDATRKFLALKNVDYDNIDSFHSNDYLLNNRINCIKTLKEMMTKDNKIGYLSTFVKYIFQVRNEHTVIGLYHQLLSIGTLSSKLRDMDGNLKNVIEFENINELTSAINRVLDWQKVNNFIRGFPSKQRNLIWSNGYYTNDVKNIANFLTENIIDISTSAEKKTIFLRKISSIKDKDALISMISRISKNEPWEYEYWLNKLKSTRNVLVTW